MLGQTLGHYRVLAKVGAGGMGEVYRARDDRLGRDVAIKVLPEAFTRDSERLARFDHEARLLAALNHPNIAAIFGLEESDGVRFLVLEFVPGETLAKRLASGPMPVEEALGICRQIAEAMEAAHERGIIHRDLKPQNVKVTPDGKVKVLDFGIAKAFAPEAAGADLSSSPTASFGSSHTGVILGTAAYMSPEQARGKPVDRRTDIWSFGCVLYETLTGRQAFPGETLSDTMAAILRAELDWAALPPELPASVRRLLRRCLEKDPNRRLRDIGDARLELEEPLAAPAQAEAGVPQPPVVRWGMAAALALLAALAAAVIVWNVKPAAEALPPSRLAVTLPANESLSIGSGAALALSPDGTRLVYVALGGGVTQLYLRALGDFQAKPIAGTEGAFGPFFSPDGQWIGFFYGISGHLKKVAVAGGTVTTLCDAQAPWGATWAPDRTIYFASRWHGESLLKVSATGGTPQKVTTPDAKKGESSHRWPHILPGGEALLFAIGAGSSFDDARIAVLNLKTGEWRTVVEGGSNPAYVPTGHLVYARAGILLAVPFDLKRLEVTGNPVPVLEGVTTSTANGEAQFSVSSDGSLAYVPGGTAQSARSLVWVDRQGRVKPVTELRRPYEDLDLSPDGKRLALTIEGPAWNIWLFDLERETLTRLTHEHTNTDPLWTPDGQRIVFTSFRDGQYGLFWKAADGSGPEERLIASPNFVHAYSWSADGRFLAYNEQHPQSKGDSWVLSFEGERKPQPFLRSSFNEWFPAFSPDGQWIAYTSDESGQSEIYVQPFPGPGGKVQISTGGGSNALWASSGRELFYFAGDKLMTVDVGTKPAFRAGKPRLLFQGQVLHTGHFYDPTSDAQRIVLIRPGEDSSPTQIHVVLNWFEELRRRSTPAAK